MAIDVAGVIRCGCGHVLCGQDEEQLLEDADLHVRTAHPELVGTLSPLELARRAATDEAAV
jgi:acetone carboxylase gamma subunit